MKWIGTVVLVLAAMQYSYAYQKHEQMKLRLLTELCDLFAYIQKNIECFSKPLGELCRGYSSPALAQLGFYDCWQEGRIHDMQHTLRLLSASEKDTVQQYFRNAGQGYKEEELQLCRYTLDRLREALKHQQ